MLKKITYGILATMLVWGCSFGFSKALTYSEIANQGKVLGDNTSTFYPYPTSTLVNDSGTIYFISGTTKVPFTNWQAFVGLGYKIKNVVEGDLTNYAPSSSYTINTADAEHPWGSWLIYKGTVYYSTQAGLIGVPSVQVFTSNGGDWTYIVKANSYDVAVLNANTTISPLAVNDPRVTTATTYQFSNNSTGQNNTNSSSNQQNSSTSAYTLSFTTNTLPAATVGQAYTGSIPFTYNGSNTVNISFSGLPSGITGPSSISNIGSIGGPTIEFQGLPTTVGTYQVTVNLNDGAGTTASRTFTMVVNSASTNSQSTFTVSPSTLNFTAVAGGSAPASQTVYVNPGSSSATWGAAIQSTAIPGLTIVSSQSTGGIGSGVGSGSFTVTAAGPFTAGTYNTSIVISLVGGQTQTVYVTLTVH